MQFAKKLKIILLSSQVCLSLCQFQRTALILGLYISFLDYLVAKVPILYIPVFISSLSL